MGVCLVEIAEEDQKFPQNARLPCEAPCSVLIISKMTDSPVQESPGKGPDHNRPCAMSDFSSTLIRRLQNAMRMSTGTINSSWPGKTRSAPQEPFTPPGPTKDFS